MRLSNQIDQGVHEISGGEQGGVIEDRRFQVDQVLGVADGETGISGLCRVVEVKASRCKLHPNLTATDSTSCNL